MLNIFRVAFFGHRNLYDFIKVDAHIDPIIEQLLSSKEYVELLVGRNGDFDQLVSSAVRRAKRKYRDDNSALVLVLPYLTAEYQNNQEAFENYYDEVGVCQRAGKAHYESAILIRNHDMVDRADLVVCYIDHLSGGAYQAVKYAKAQNKPVINIFDTISE